MLKNNPNRRKTKFVDLQTLPPQKKFAAKAKNRKMAATIIQQNYRNRMARNNKTSTIKNDLALTRPGMDSRSVNDNYLKSLMFPETADNARIPSRYPLQSGTFHKHMTVKSTVNASGNAVLLWNPYFLYDTSSSGTGLIINNAATLTLTAPEVTTGYTGISMPFGLPPNTYTDYRLVSASIKIIVNTPNLNATGIVGGGIIPSRGQDISAFVVGSSYFPFNGAQTVQANIDQALYFKQGDISKHEDLRIIYYPFDPTYEMFVDVNYNRQTNMPAASQFNVSAYISAAAASTSFTLEFDYNFETLIYPTAKGYIPVGITSESYEAGKAVRVVISDENNITKTGANINQVIEKEESTFINKLLNAGGVLGRAALSHLPELVSCFM
jgi:hypothetical protein